MYVICGLGNPGRQYENTRHNVGFRAIDVLAEKMNTPVKSLKFKALLGEGRIGGEKVVLVKPQTYMNLSGESLREIVAYYKVEPEKLIVIYDDVDLDIGRLRIRAGGSSGSHNGMKSVIYQLQFDNFPRIRVGLGPNGNVPLDAFVISAASGEDAKMLEEGIANAAEAAYMIVSEGIVAAQQKYNTKKEKV